MKKISRIELRGGKPFPFHQVGDSCKQANTTTHEFGPDDNRVFCYGLYTSWQSGYIRKECLECEAYVYNAKPLKEDLSE